MNTINKIPIWQPYIRITTMLQILGHQISTRKDLTKKDIQIISYTYYPYLTSIFKTQQQCIEYRKKQQITQPLLIYLINKYIDNDKIKYDAYIHYVEDIDNQRSQEEIQKILDPLTWEAFVQLFQLYAKSMRNIQLDTNLSYKINQIFWRICQSKNVQLQTGIKLLQIFSNNLNLIDSTAMGIISRIKDAIQKTQYLYFKFLPSQAYLVCLKSIKKIDRFPDYLKMELYTCLGKNLVEAFMWNDGDKQEILKFYRDNKIQLSQETVKFLENTTN